MGEAGLDDVDPRIAESVLELGDDVRIGAQRDVVAVEIVVGVLGSEVTDRGLALHDDIVVVLVHLEGRPCCVDDPPDDDRGDLDRVALGVVDLRDGVWKLWMRLLILRDSSLVNGFGVQCQPGRSIVPM